MPNISAILKQEITRIARKELRGNNLSLKKASAQYRTEIAALKRRIQALEKQSTRLSKTRAKQSEPESAEDSGETRHRFSAKGLAAQRVRLGLSAIQVATLLGVSGQSIYKREAGKTRPRASQLPAIATLRGMSKTKAAELLAEATS